ncbi:MAG: methyltransferase [Bacteriovoracaceae bacterium]
MNDYCQPSFYRFNSDSLKLVEFIKNRVSKSHSILDLGAGCGIIGIELAKYYFPVNLILLELQNDFLPSLEKNLQEYLPRETKGEIIISSFSNFKAQRKFDLVVSNPPYYLPKHGEPSSDRRRGLARSFIQDNWTIFLRLLRESLNPEGEGFVVIKNDKVILEEVRQSVLTSSLVIKEWVEGDLVFLNFRLNVD